jgi:arylsulfatase A-like enzyme
MKNRLFPFILPGASRQKEIPSSSGAPLIRVKRILTCLTLLLFSGDLHAEADPSSEAPRDHVLFITIDDLNDWIGCMTDPVAPDAPSGGRVVGRGHPQASTPNMDRLVERGVLFTNAHCQAPICRPSRNSFMSGLRPTTSGIYGNRSKYDAKGFLKPGKESPWLTKRFEQAGYHTFNAGKILHGSQNKPLGGTACFKTNQGPYPPNKLNVPKEITPASIWDIGAHPEKEEDDTDLRIAKWTASNIRKPYKPGDKPRFMALGFYNPHLPLFAPKKWFEAAPSKKEVLLGAVSHDDFDDLPAISKRIGSRVSYAACARWCLEDEKNLRTLTQAYLACTSAMDDSLGKVIDALDQSDMANNTWIVVLSDHGWHLGEKDHIAKQTLWSRSTHVPLIVVPPKRLKDAPRGLRCARPAELLDVYPTLIDATGLTPALSDKHLDGLSLMPWLNDPAAEKSRPAITTLYGHNHSLVGDRHRYTRYADGSEELYDRQTDPHEFENLMAQVQKRPELQAVIKRLSAYLPGKEAGKPDLILKNHPK